LTDHVAGRTPRSPRKLGHLHHSPIVKVRDHNGRVMAFRAASWHVVPHWMGKSDQVNTVLLHQLVHYSTLLPEHYSAPLLGSSRLESRLLSLPSLGISLPSVQKLPQKTNVLPCAVPVSRSTPHSGNRSVNSSWQPTKMLLGRCLATSRGRDVLSEKKAACNSRFQFLRYVDLCGLRHSNRQKGIQAPQSGSECTLRVLQERVQRKLEGKS
jgi:hypothetical protein